MKKDAKRIRLLLLTVFVMSTTGVAQTVVSDTLTKANEDFWIDATEGYSKVLNKSKFGDNWFFGFHAGTTLNWGSNQKHSSFPKRFRPIGGISFGKWLSPYVGARLQGSLAKNRGIMTDTYNEYSWLAFGALGDAMFNFTNLFNGYQESRPFNFVGFLGIGAERTCSYKDLPNPNHTKLCDWLLTGRLGLMGIFRLNHAWDFTIEATNSWIDDSYDGIITHDTYDGHVNVMIGLVYRLKNHDGAHQFTHARRDWTKYDIMNTEINRLRQKAADDRAYAAAHPNIAYVQSRQINTLISFAEGSSVIDPLQEVNVYTAVEAMRELPHADLYITVLGKAVKDLNLFMERAQSIRDVLTKEYNIPAGRIYIEKSPALVESLDKANDCVIMYINE